MASGLFLSNEVFSSTKTALWIIGNFSENTSITMQENQNGDVYCKIATILSTPQLVTQYSIYENLSVTFIYGYQRALRQIAQWLPYGIIPGASRNKTIPWVFIIYQPSGKCPALKHFTSDEFRRHMCKL